MPQRGSFGPPIGNTPTDLALLVGVIFVTFSLQYFETTAVLLSNLRLGLGLPGLLWQPLTYAFVAGPVGFWIILVLYILWMFAISVRQDLGQNRFWRLLIEAIVLAALAAVAVAFVMSLVSPTSRQTFSIMQGERTLLAVVIAAFAILHRNATILMFFVVPMQARYLIPLEIVFAFIAFLGSKDLAGFIGICVAVGWVWFRLTGGRRSNRGGPGGGLFKETRLRLTKWWMQRKLDAMRKKRGFKIVPGGKSNGGKGNGGRGNGGGTPWVH
jgi:hypothetical protein